MTIVLRAAVTIGALALAMRVALDNERGGMEYMARAIVVAGLLALIVWTWRSSAASSSWVLLAGGVAVGGWLALTWSWATPVDSMYGSCGSTLDREQPPTDQDGQCDWLVGEAYDRDTALMLGTIAISLVAAGGALRGTQGEVSAGTESRVSESSTR